MIYMLEPDNFGRLYQLYADLWVDFLKVRFGIRTFPACFARFLPTYIVVGGWPWCVIILANEKRIFK